MSENYETLQQYYQEASERQEKRRSEEKALLKDVDVKTEDEAIWISEKCVSMVDQFRRKNTAYGDSFGKQFEKYGSVSALVRISDKFSRIEALMLGAQNEVSDERLEDTLVDMACYCMMTLYELDNC